MKLPLRHLRNRHLFLLDAVLLAASTLGAYVVRFEGFDWGTAILYTALVYLAVSLPLKLGVLLYVGLYRRLWRFAGAAELEHILVATAISASLSGLVGAALLPGLGHHAAPGPALACSSSTPASARARWRCRGSSSGCSAGGPSGGGSRPPSGCSSWAPAPRAR